MVRRGLSLSFRILAWLIATAAVIAAIVVWRLASGPISLAPLTPYLEAALSPDDAPIEVEVGRTELRLADGEIALVGLDVRGIGPDDTPVFELPEVRVDLSPEALVLHGVIAPTRLVAMAPQLALVRGRDGRIGLRGLDASADEATFDLGGAVAGYLLHAPDPAAPLSYLRLVEISGAALALEDEITGRSFAADDAVLTLERQSDALEARLALEIEQPGHVVPVEVRGRHTPETGRIAFALAFAGMRPSDLASFAPVPADLPLGGLHVTLTGEVAGEIGLDGELYPIQFAVEAGEGTIDLPDVLDRPLTVSAAQAEGTLGADLDRLELERFSLAVEGATLEGTGSLEWGEAGVSLAAEVEAANVRAQDLHLFWPPEAGRRAREWVVSNITEGVVPRAFARIELEPEDFGRKPLRRAALSGSFEFDDLTIRYFRTMPPVTDVGGTAAFTGQTLRFAIREGGIDGLQARDGTVTITGIGVAGRDTTQLEIALDIEGPVDQALRLIDYPPLGFADDLGLDPEQVSGRSRTDLRLGLPLHREVEIGELRVAAEAELREVAAQGLFGEFDLSDGAFTLSVDRQGMDLDGQASVQSVPLDITWRENFDRRAEFDRRYRLEGLLDEAALVALGMAPPVPLQGGFWLDLVATETAGTRRLQADLDLAPAALALPRLGWEKAAGQPGQLTIEAVMPPDGPLDVDRFELAAAGLNAAGRAVIEREPMRLEALTLDRFRHQQQRGSARVRRDGDGYVVTINAQSLDLNPLLDERADADAGAGDPPILVTARADEVIAGEHRLSEVTANLARDEEGWRSVDLRGRLPEGGRVELTLFPEGAERHLSLTSTDAGELLRTLDQSRQVVGGNLVLTATISRQRPDLAAKGTLEITDFTLLDAPVLARLLTLASLTGIGNLLGGQGIFVDRLEIPFELAGDVLILDDGRLSGSQLGLTLEGAIDLEREQVDLDGTVVPIYTLNRAIGSIPVLGNFLTGSEGEGAFAATYSIQGPRDDPQVTVNPLAVLAPGFIRELFSGILEGTLEPPDLPDTGDR